MNIITFQGREWWPIDIQCFIAAYNGKESSFGVSERFRLEIDQIHKLASLLRGCGHDVRRRTNGHNMLEGERAEFVVTCPNGTIQTIGGGRDEIESRRPNLEAAGYTLVEV